jgi:hypothetical protein
MTPEQINLMSNPPPFSINQRYLQTGALAQADDCLTRAAAACESSDDPEAVEYIEAIAVSVRCVVPSSTSLHPLHLPPTSSLEPIDVIAVSVRCVVHF